MQSSAPWVGPQIIKFPSVISTETFYTSVVSPGLSECLIKFTLLYLSAVITGTYQDVDGRIILRWIFRKLEGAVGTGWSWLRVGRGGGHLWVR